MKTIAKLILIYSVLFSFLIAETEENIKPKWKGKIEYENGVKAIKNPKEPLYGEIMFELEEDLTIGKAGDPNTEFFQYIGIDFDNQGNVYVFDRGNYRIQKFGHEGNYLQTIGKRGQGPGEFDRPMGIYLDHEEKLYVMDLRKLHVFNKEGKFIKTIRFDAPIVPFAITREGKIVGKISNLTREKYTDDICLFNQDGEKQKTIASLPRPMPDFTQSPNQLPILYIQEGHLEFTPLNEDLLVYGISSEYKLFVINPLGEIAYIIEKEESPQPYSKKEKERLVNSIIRGRERRGVKVSRSEVRKSLKFPKSRPIYSRIFTDDRGNIYTLKDKTVSSGKRIWHFDMFNKEGYFLCKVKIPQAPLVIKNGYIYSVRIDPENSYIKVIRYKIKNWNQIEERT